MMRYLKNMEKEIIIDNKLDEIAKIAQFIEELGMSATSFRNHDEY